MSSLQGKVAIVTGCSRGIAERLGHDKASVVVTKSSQSQSGGSGR